MSDVDLIRHCAPTLAGLKTANMFTCPCNCRETLKHFVRDINKRLLPKGIRVLPLRFSGEKALIYLYRPQKLLKDLDQDAAKRILHQCGYDTTSCEKCVVQLVKKLRQQCDFPHEIGLFLGYPPEDVCGFMENKACGCKCVGCWKVYGDEEAARKKFAQYKKCTKVYWEQWAKGTNIERLAVKNR